MPGNIISSTNSPDAHFVEIPQGVAKVGTEPQGVAKVGTEAKVGAETKILPEAKATTQTDEEKAVRPITKNLSFLDSAVASGSCLRRLASVVDFSDFGIPRS